MTFDLTGTRAFVTGAGTGIGRSVALELARAGADVAITYRTHDGGPVVAELTALGRTAVALPMDATDSADVDRVVAHAAEALGGGIDVLVNNAGGLVGRRSVTEMTDEHWHAVLDVNLTSMFLVTRSVLRHMPDGGRIISISSQAGQNGGGPGAAAYAAAKAGMDGLTRALAKELGPRRITANSVAPGFIGDTPFQETFTPQDAQRAAIAGIPVGRPGVPADVAAAAVYLASEQAGFTNGAVIDVNGGAWLR
ncbi:SDR family NAD(P)-dependent oxidoreductase [uncultured Cellulomonas sp.]|uniref:SDR family NAD(P)-dependent oxidoreductase n=1 Tax=uncultured Cellulomonas sp. TaxID=189682 RepID=UPI0026129D62|nr:SDR family oxidoreductase [uncultured Cellulomonas sp.]